MNLPAAHRLQDLPFPLLPPPARPASPLTYIATQQDASRYESVTGLGLQPLGAEVIKRAAANLYTAENQGMDAREFARLVREDRLVHLHHGVYRSPDTKETALLRALSLGLLVPDGYLFRLRFSRLSAAWILGYLDALPNGRMDIDYDRDRRFHLPAKARPLFAPHQTVFAPFDSYALGDVAVTNPLRTASDVLATCDTEEALDAVRRILLDPDNSVTPELLLASLEERPHILYRTAVMERAKFLINECTLKLKRQW